jgi:hypothetical protein
VIAISAFAYNQLIVSRNSYNSEIQYSVSRSPVVYDYSCDEYDYQIHFVIMNSGVKNVLDFSASITNPLCVGGNPILLRTLNASSTLSFYAQSTNPNGTLTISGNNTFVQIKF